MNRLGFRFGSHVGQVRMSRSRRGPSTYGATSAIQPVVNHQRENHPGVIERATFDPLGIQHVIAFRNRHHFTFF